MARVVLTGGLLQITGEVAEFDLTGETVRQIFRQLSELYPALKPHLEEGVAVSIDGQIYQDPWLESVGRDSEVYVLPALAGG